MYNIDGDYGYGNQGGLWDGDGNFSNGFFGCLIEETDDRGHDETEDNLNLISNIPSNSNGSNPNSSKTIDSFQFNTFADFLAASRGDSNDFPNTESEVSVESDCSSGTPKTLSVKTLHLSQPVMSPMEEPLEESPEPKKKEVSVARYSKKRKKKKKNKPTTEKGMATEPVAGESAKDSTVLNSLLIDAAIQQSEIIHFLMHTDLSIWWM